MGGTGKVNNIKSPHLMIQVAGFFLSLAVYGFGFFSLHLPLYLQLEQH